MSKIFAVVAVALLFLSGTLAVAYAEEEAGVNYPVENEMFVADPGNATELEYSYISNATYTERVTVRRTEGGDNTRLVPGEDYEWDDENGTITILQGGRLADGEQASIDYSYRVATDTQENLAAMYAGFFEIGGPLVFVLMVGVALAAVIKLGS